LTYADEAHPKIALAVLIRGNSFPHQGTAGRWRCRTHLPPVARTELFRAKLNRENPGYDLFRPLISL